jgi:hypothetical protein
MRNWIFLNGAILIDGCYHLCPSLLMRENNYWYFIIPNS